MDKIRIVSLNVRSLRSNKRYKIYQWLKEKECKICLLQETYCTQDYISVINKGWNGEIFHSVTDSPHSRGVSILLSNKLDYSVISHHNDTEGRILLLNLVINNQNYTICNVYSPNFVTNKLKFFHDVKTFINAHAIAQHHLILGGDFNSVDCELDRASNKLDKCSTVLKELKSDLNITDIWRFLNPHTIDYSYIDPSSRGHNSRIDFLLCSPLITNTAKTSFMTNAPTPDHKAVILDFGLESKKRGPGYWKMNNSVLNDEEYIDGIHLLFSNTIDEYLGHVSKQLLWEYLKIKVKDFTISYCSKKSIIYKCEVKVLEEKLNKIDQCIKQFSTEHEKELERKKLKLELDQLYDQKSKGYQIRSRAKWVESGERSTKYFLNLEKSRQSSNCIYSLKDNNNLSYNLDSKILA